MDAAAALRRLKALAPLVVFAAVVLPLAFRWQQVSAAAPHAVLSAPVFLREGLPELSQLMATSKHLLLVGPTGVGKTLAATAAARASGPFATPGGLVCLLPFYVDLYAIAASAGASGAAENVHARALRGFADESRRYDLPLVREVHNATRLGLLAHLQETVPTVWQAVAAMPLLAMSLLPRRHETSLYGILSHLVEASQTLKRWRRCEGGHIRPVLILDEVHTLNDTDMEPVRADLLRFLSPQLQSKGAADITIVLLSSDARAHDILHSWTPRGKLARRLEVLTVGDLHEREVRPFLQFLGGANRTVLSPHFLDAPGMLEATYARVGGYIPDLERVWKLAALDDVVDASAVAAFVAAPDAVLAAHGLEAQHVLTVLEAILSRGVSPRGAVPLASLLPHVPQAQLSAMEAANLVEVRRRAVMGGPDYPELRQLPPGAYVLAPSPLARVSMAAAVQLLRTLRRGEIVEQE